MSIIRTCESCGDPIEGAGQFGWDGKWYCCTEHMPMRQTPPCAAMVIHTLRLLLERAEVQHRDYVNCADLSWAIQELER